MDKIEFVQKRKRRKKIAYGELGLSVYLCITLLSLYNVVCFIGLCVKHVILSDFRQDFAPKWIIERAILAKYFYDATFLRL
jgi:hypothetical protein